MIYTIAGGGAYCSGDTGVHIYLSASQFGIRYQLYRGVNPVGAPRNGTGVALDWGLFTTVGIYTVIATDTTTLCTSHMMSSVAVSVNSLPLVFNVTGGGTFCAGGAGYPIGVDSSTVGVRYQLYRGFTAVGTPVAGTGHPFSFGTFTTGGTYTVVATNLFSLCNSNMTGSATIIVNPLPGLHTIIGGGTFCEGGTGYHIKIDGSDTGITYRLYFYDTTAVGAPVAGTGDTLDFGVISVSGHYTVLGTNNHTGCAVHMPGLGVININPAPTRYAVTGGGSYCQSASGLHVGLANSNTGVNYQLTLGGSPVGGPVAGTAALSISDCRQQQACIQLLQQMR